MCLQKNIMTFLYLFAEILIIFYAICMQCVTVCAIPYFMFSVVFFSWLGMQHFIIAVVHFAERRRDSWTNLVHNCLKTVMIEDIYNNMWMKCNTSLFAYTEVLSSGFSVIAILHSHFWSFPFTLIHSGLDHSKLRISYAIVHGNIWSLVSLKQGIGFCWWTTE